MSNAYMAHGYCFLWQPPLVALHVVSDLLIALAYFSIPVALWYFVRRRTDIPFGALFVMFGAFIVCCGITHIMSIVTIWNPVYWLDGGLKALTAAVSVATAIVLAPTIPKALTLRSPAELERVNAELRSVIEQKEELLAAYQRERKVATALQEALLPQRLPERAGVTFASSYHAAADDVEIGGDWFDAFAISEHQIGISCGDVAGHGLPAATLMGTTRQMVRTAAREDDDPSIVLGRVNRALCAEDNDLLVTAFYGVLDTTSGRLRYALAGHPAPLLVDPFEGAAYLSGQGLLLGLDPQAGYPKSEALLRPQSMLVLYTDGLVEAEHDMLGALDRLAHVASTVVAGGVENAAEAIHAGLLGDIPARDDAAVLTVKVDYLGAPGSDGLHRTWHIDVAEGRNGQALRMAVTRYLREHATADSSFFEAELILGEMLANIAQHTPGHARVDLAWVDGAAVLVVEDQGDPIVRVGAGDVMSESGRGLALIETYGRDLTIERTERGNRIRVVLPVCMSRQ